MGASSQLPAAILIAACVSSGTPLSAQEAVSSPCEAWGRADAVFVGVAQPQVRKVVHFTDHEPPALTLVLTPFVVERAYKGVSTSTAYLELGQTFEAGERFLVYGTAYAEQNVFMAVRRGMPSKRLSQAAADLAFLDVLDSASGTVTITGQVRRRTKDLIARQIRQTPLGDALLRITGPDGVYRVRAARDGSYALRGVPPGAYRVEAEMGDRERTLSDAATIARGGCGVIDVAVHSNGRIAGRVTGPVPSLSSVPVDVIPADVEPDETGHVFGAGSTTTNLAGAFTFEGLPPGRYLLGINLYQRPWPGQAFEPTYYPGTPNGAEAGVIELGEGELVSGLELPVWPPRERAWLTIVIPDAADGVQTFVCVRNPAEPRKMRARYNLRFQRLPLTIDVVPGETYEVHAHRESAGLSYDSESVELTAVPGAQQIALSGFAAAPRSPHLR